MKGTRMPVFTLDPKKVMYAGSQIAYASRRLSNLAPDFEAHG